MKEIILLKSGEMALKGLNRSSFEDTLIANAKRRLKDLGEFKIRKAQSAIYVEPLADGIDMDEAFERMRRLFGASALSRCCVVAKEFDAIVGALDYLAPQLSAASTFKVTAKRSDKKFPLDSPALCQELGGVILSRYRHLSVDVHNPDLTVVVEVRDFGAYLHAGQVAGAGGMPVGTAGNAALLISGGIDSPVAGYMMAKRGLQIIGIHFASPPYTSERALLKVKQLCAKMSRYTGRIKLAVVHFTEIQEVIAKSCPEEYFTIIMRRFMMEIASIVALKNDCGAVITGESVAQVASQTMQAIACTEECCKLPVFRPVIGMDKDEIVEIAKRIDTFETSILPYEDCCTVFTPKHPRTRPQLAAVKEAEAPLDRAALIDRALQNITWYGIDEQTELGI